MDHHRPLSTSLRLQANTTCALRIAQRALKGAVDSVGRGIEDLPHDYDGEVEIWEEDVAEISTLQTGQTIVKDTDVHYDQGLSPLSLSKAKMNFRCKCGFKWRMAQRR